MSPLQAALLGALQGLTEFLPISSSAHLFAVPALLGWPYAGLAFDVALHWGTLLAMLIAFWRDWWDLLGRLVAPEDEVRREALSTWGRLAAGSVPAAVAGLLLQEVAETHLRALPLQAAMLAVFGFLLWWVDRVAPQGGRVRVPGWGACMLIGTAQAIALVPGVSRSGITITAGRAAGLDRVSAARFSFLLGTPIMFGAGLLELRHAPPELFSWTVGLGVLTSAVFGLIAIRGLIHWVSRAGFGVFFVYRLALAALLLFAFGSR
jgi:undecaprenyl-diphosphatase